MSCPAKAVLFHVPQCCCPRGVSGCLSQCRLVSSSSQSLLEALAKIFQDIPDSGFPAFLLSKLKLGLAFQPPKRFRYVHVYIPPEKETEASVPRWPLCTDAWLLIEVLCAIFLSHLKELLIIPCSSENRVHKIIWQSVSENRHMSQGYGPSLLMNGWVAPEFPLKRSYYIFLAEMGIRRLLQPRERVQHVLNFSF